MDKDEFSTGGDGAQFNKELIEKAKKLGLNPCTAFLPSADLFANQIPAEAAGTPPKEKQARPARERNKALGIEQFNRDAPLVHHDNLAAVCARLRNGATWAEAIMADPVFVALNHEFQQTKLDAARALEAANVRAQQADQLLIALTESQRDYAVVHGEMNAAITRALTREKANEALVRDVQKLTKDLAFAERTRDDAIGSLSAVSSIAGWRRVILCWLGVPKSVFEQFP